LALSIFSRPRVIFLRPKPACTQCISLFRWSLFFVLVFNYYFLGAPTISGLPSASSPQSSAVLGGRGPFITSTPFPVVGVSFDLYLYSPPLLFDSLSCSPLQWKYKPSHCFMGISGQYSTSCLHNTWTFKCLSLYALSTVFVPPYDVLETSSVKKNLQRSRRLFFFPFRHPELLNITSHLVRRNRRLHPAAFVTIRPPPSGPEKHSSPPLPIWVLETKAAFLLRDAPCA